MTVQNKSKLNRLTQILPEGLFVDASWLEKHGYSRSLRSQYVSAGWLYQPTRSVYRRTNSPISWEQVFVSLYALLECPVSIGGRSALERQGYAHYLPQTHETIHLYSDNKLPSWLFKLPSKEKFLVHNRHRFLPGTKITIESHPQLVNEETYREAQSALGLRTTLWGEWEWPIVMSKPERAILELLDELPKNESFHNADVTMEGLVNISPSRMQSLLEMTSSIKVKRLFFFFADRHQHSWLKHIKREKINLGKGKRMLVKGGKFDPTYQITVPEYL